MPFARKFLLIIGSLFVVAGLAFLLLPQQSVGFVDVSLPTLTAIVEIQGFYGGQMAGIGILLLVTALQPSLTSVGLLVVIASLGGTAVGRLIGMSMGGELPVRMAVLFVVEAGTAVTAAVILTRHET
jgi:hypothetical protein